MHQKKRAALWAAAGLAAVLAAGTSRTAYPDSPPVHPRLLAHRGLAQTFDITKVKWDTNTAAMIDPIEHPFIENTIPSMRAAFA